MADKELWLWLSGRIKSGNMKMKTLIDRFGSISEVYGASPDRLASVSSLRDADIVGLSDKSLAYSKAVLDECRRKNIRVITPFDGEYPSRLFDIADAPTVLFARGLPLPAEEVPTVGIVGTRNASSEGLDAVSKIAGEVARGGGVVVSGLACGIDTAAAKAALENGGTTVAVFGCGADICYPAENKRLMERIIYNGTVVSEYPPGTRPTRASFPKRNRIISGLSSAVVIGECPERSGALITADYAEKQKRKLFAIPAGVFSQSSGGANLLISGGKAQAVFSGADIEGIKESAPIKKKTETLKGNKARIYDEIEKSPKTPDELIKILSLPPASVLSDLTMLEITGKIRRKPGNIFEIKRI